MPGLIQKLRRFVGARVAVDLMPGAQVIVALGKDGTGAIGADVWLAHERIGDIAACGEAIDALLWRQRERLPRLAAIDR